MHRISALEQMITDRPDDPFPVYGLALEHRGQGDHAQAWTWFQVLLERFPDYLPAYLMAGGTLAALDRPDEASELLRRGIELAGRAGDGHTRSELEAALADLADPT